MDPQLAEVRRLRKEQAQNVNNNNVNNSINAGNAPFFEQKFSIFEMLPQEFAKNNEQSIPEFLKSPYPIYYYILFMLGLLFFLLNFSGLWPLFLLFGLLAYGIYSLVPEAERQQLSNSFFNKDISAPNLNTDVNLTFKVYQWAAAGVIFCMFFGPTSLMFVFLVVGGVYVFQNQGQLGAKFENWKAEMNVQSSSGGGKKGAKKKR